VIPLQLPSVDVLLQPVVDLRTFDVVAAEALSRLGNDVPVLELLEDARAQGTVDQVEAHLLRWGLAARSRVPDQALLCLNVTAGALTGRAGFALLDALPTLTGTVLELRQEREWDADAVLLDRLEQLRGKGALLALDDAAQGFQGLLAISRLRPDWVKVDRSVVTGSLDDPVRRAGLDMFAQSAQRAGSLLVAEGVETEQDLQALARVGVTMGQGYLLSPPVAGPVPPHLRAGRTAAPPA
jgi:EAL domain-containing protein (putative c-di-GMP-specific phosphodiesterase class I)